MWLKKHVLSQHRCYASSALNTKVTQRWYETHTASARCALRLSRGYSLLAKMSTGEPSGSSHGQPLNCQAGPCTNTATTRSLRGEGVARGLEDTLWLVVGTSVSDQPGVDADPHQSCGASLSGWSMIRYGTVTLRVVPPGWIWSLRRWSSTSLSR